MTTNANNEIVSATVAELKEQWKKGEWNTVYDFDEYLRIQKEVNKIGIEIKNEK